MVVGSKRCFENNTNAASKSLPVRRGAKFYYGNQRCRPPWMRIAKRDKDRIYSCMHTYTHIRTTLTGAAVSIFMKYIAVLADALVHAVVKFIAELLAWRSMPASSWNTAEKRGREQSYARRGSSGRRTQKENIEIGDGGELQTQLHSRVPILNSSILSIKFALCYICAAFSAIKWYKNSNTHRCIFAFYCIFLSTCRILFTLRVCVVSIYCFLFLYQFHD